MAQGGQCLTTHPHTEEWRGCVRHWFPKLQEKAYFVPPVYMNRVHYVTQEIAGLNIDVTQPPVEDQPQGAPPGLQHAHVRDDQTQQRVLQCLQKMAEQLGQPMVVISQLQFGDFLREPCYAAAAKTLPRPVDLKDAKKDRGDFDLLFIHKEHGLVVGEMKTIGDNLAEHCPEEEKQDDLVAQKVQQMMKQLDKAGDVLKHLVSDLKHPPRVTKTMMLPNISRHQLHRVLKKHHHLKKDLCKCLGLKSSSDPLKHCLCSDHLPERRRHSDVTDDVIKSLSEWWRHVVAGHHHRLTEDAYEDLVARFAGPATTVQVFWIDQPRHHFRSHGEGVHETSFRFTRITLHPEQVNILNQLHPLVWLCGPPGTGKTLVLAVRAKDWWSRGGDVHVFSSHDGSLAASHLIYHQLLQTAGPEGERVHLHEFSFRSLMGGKVESAVKSLLKASQKAGPAPLCVIADEAYHGGEFTEFCNELCQRVPGLHLWAASMYHNHRPPCLVEVPMTEPLRTPPVITRQVREADSIQRHHKVWDYTEGLTPAPTYGPETIYLYHRGRDHDDGNPVQCEKCGREIAQVLKELHVNLPGPAINASVSPATKSSCNPSSGCSSTAGQACQPNPTQTPTLIPAPLQYRDVFLLSAWDHDDFKNDSGLVVGLRKAGVPVKVLKYGDSEAVRGVAVMEGGDEVIAAYAGAVSGLERPVVVWVQTHRTGTETADEDIGRLMAISRTTAQLVWVVWPWDNHEDDD